MPAQHKDAVVCKQLQGYSGIDEAPKLLDGMICEPNRRYDAGVAKFTDYYSKTCAAMEAF